VTNSRLKNDYFGKSTRSITKKSLEEAILKALEDGKPEKDVVGLLIMLLFTAILFPQACSTVPVHLFKYAENLEQIGNYSWGEAVYLQLMTHIPYCAMWCKMMENGADDTEESDSGEEEEDSSDEDKQQPSGTLPGCGLALEVSFVIMYK
jgi:hypothetical protein